MNVKWCSNLLLLVLLFFLFGGIWARQANPRWKDLSTDYNLLAYCRADKVKICFGKQRRGGEGGKSIFDSDEKIVLARSRFLSTLIVNYFFILI